MVRRPSSSPWQSHGTAARLASFSLFSALMLPALAARAQAPAAWVPPPEVLSGGVASEPEPAPRPRLSVSVGMGATFDSVGFADGTHALPAFFATGGAGDGLVGLDFGVFASSAIGRIARTNPVDRQSLSAFATVRPAAPLDQSLDGYAVRVLRTFACEVGMGVERDGRTADSATRFFIHLGARLEFPLTPVDQPSELRIRLGVMRNLGLDSPTLAGATPADVTDVVDTTAETYAALVVLF
jgi:hypothetical protein